jgi:hypothetical protein
LVERGLCKPEVVGSIPIVSTKSTREGTAMTNDNADAPGDANTSDAVPGDPNDAPHVVYDPPPASRANISRQQRALRRVYKDRTIPSWVQHIPWVIFPVYWIMRRHDPNYEEHYVHWEEQERKNYDGGESQ